MPCGRGPSRLKVPSMCTINCKIFFGLPKTCPLVLLTLLKLFSLHLLIIVPWMLQNQAWVESGSHLLPMSLLLSPLINPIIFNNLACGDPLSHRLFKTTLSPSRIQLAPSLTVTLNLPVPSPVMISSHLLSQVHIYLPAAFGAITPLLYLGKQKGVPQQLDQLHTSSNSPHYTSFISGTNLSFTTLLVIRTQ